MKNTKDARYNAKARKRITEAGGKRIDVVLSKIGLHALSELQGETNENISLTVEMALQSALERCREKPASHPAQNGWKSTPTGLVFETNTTEEGK